MRIAVIVLVLALVQLVAPILDEVTSPGTVPACAQCGSLRASMAVVPHGRLGAIRVCVGCARSLKAEGKHVIKMSQRCSSCVRRATFGPLGRPPERCKEHRLDGEVDTANKRCRHPDCGRQPTYGDPTNGGPTHCMEHKLEHHSNLKRKSWRPCQAPEGARLPHLPGGATRLMLDPMILTGLAGCRKRARFGLFGAMSKFCARHKHAAHIDLGNRRCQHVGCLKQPTFGDPVQGKGAETACAAKTCLLDARAVRVARAAP